MKICLTEGDFQRGFHLERGLSGFPQHKNRRKRWKAEISNSNCSAEAFNRTTQRVPCALVIAGHEGPFPGPGLERHHDLWGSSVRAASGRSQQEHGPQWLRGFCRRVSLTSFQPALCQAPEVRKFLRHELQLRWKHGPHNWEVSEESTKSLTG